MKEVRENITYILVAAIFALLSTQCKDAKEAAVTKALEVVVKKINGQCPKQIHQYVRIDSCKVSDKMTIKFFTTVLNIDADFYNAVEFAKFTKPAIVYYVQTRNELKMARDLGVIFVFSYNDDSGKNLGEATVGPDDYNQPIDESRKDIASMKAEDVDKLLEKMASGIKRLLPMKVDEITALTDFNALPDKTLELVYTINMAKKDLVPNFEDNAKKGMKESIKTMPEFEKMINSGIIVKAIYNDKDGNEICRISLSAEDYK
jgi:hypothetical protein